MRQMSIVLAVGRKEQHISLIVTQAVENGLIFTLIMEQI